ncbi:glycerol uptake operon antiterminator [Seinonella peptonophila]|uniref:Glycerol uptake operon antiterminator regulatory protein n=1 Tax=Seinonella peptonophila TaxID=112248 RepID=A0A1M5BN79_9BACL|nr:glycerol-3-phosphate responsive antiterminator [Seinonella peptonophila]SHF43978.1 glycerol uptake operon antiterminator [Seinonella peptonophila]
MHFNQQVVLPATGNLKHFERLLDSNFVYLVLLESHLARLRSLIQLANRHQKKVLLHVDLIQGLRSDEYAVDYLSQEVRPAGLISTRTPVVKRARKKSLLGIQRLFLLDTHALHTSLRLLEQFQPDYIEVLPGILPHMIKQIAEHTNVPILAGGFIQSTKEVEAAISAGAVATTTSHEPLWKKYNR